MIDHLLEGFRLPRLQMQAEVAKELKIHTGTAKEKREKTKKKKTSFDSQVS